MGEDPATNATADGFNDLEDDDEEESGDWKPRSLAEILPSHQFLHIPPHRLVLFVLCYIDQLSLFYL